MRITVIHEGHAYTAEIDGERVDLFRDGAAYHEESTWLAGSLDSDCRQLVAEGGILASEVKRLLEKALREKLADD